MKNLNEDTKILIDALVDQCRRYEDWNLDDKLTQMVDMGLITEDQHTFIILQFIILQQFGDYNDNI